MGEHGNGQASISALTADWQALMDSEEAQALLDTSPEDVGSMCIRQPKTEQQGAPSQEAFLEALVYGE